jgi:hypothetical protein
MVANRSGVKVGVLCSSAGVNRTSLLGAMAETRSGAVVVGGEAKAELVRGSVTGEG